MRGGSRTLPSGVIPRPRNSCLGGTGRFSTKLCLREQQEESLCSGCSQFGLRFMKDLEDLLLLDRAQLLRRKTKIRAAKSDYRKMRVLP